MIVVLAIGSVVKNPNHFAIILLLKIFAIPKNVHHYTTVRACFRLAHPKVATLQAAEARTTTLPYYRSHSPPFKFPDSYVRPWSHSENRVSDNSSHVKRTIIKMIEIESMTRYVSPINPAIFPILAIVLLGIGIFFTAWFFVYEVTSTKFTRDIYKELLVSLVAAIFSGFGVLFLMLWVGIYV